jgi:hypothetical protein
MQNRTAATLVLHGVIVIALGLVAGFPYATAVTSGADAETVRAWRMAHLEGLLNGMLVVALGAATPLLQLRAAQERWLRVGALAAGYGNVLAASLGAATRVRGLVPEGPLANWIVYVGFVVAIGGVVLALAIAALGAKRALSSAA